MADVSLSFNALLARVTLQDLVVNLKSEDVLVLNIPDIECGPACQVFYSFDCDQRYYPGSAMDLLRSTAAKIVREVTPWILQRSQGYPIVPVVMPPRSYPGVEVFSFSDGVTGLAAMVESSYNALENSIANTFRMAYKVSVEMFPFPFPKAKIGDTINVRRPPRFTGVKP